MALSAIGILLFDDAIASLYTTRSLQCAKLQRGCC